jgi:hypothetical protein
VIGIDLLNPVRRSTDRNSWGNVSGIYADPDGVRPIYFATVDRTKVRGLSNGVRRRTVDGVEQVRYFFSIDAEALREDPWTDGMVYVLPREPFEHTERQEWTCRQPLRPLARIPVSPADFPFRAQTLGFECWHFDQRLREAFAGFPYLQDVREFAIRPETLSTRRH